MLQLLLAPLCALSLLLAQPALGMDTSALDINQASASQLAQLPGIGPAKADAIIKEREAHGPFLDAEDLTRVSGIGHATVSRLANHLSFEQESRSDNVARQTNAGATTPATTAE